MVSEGVFAAAVTRPTGLSIGDGMNFFFGFTVSWRGIGEGASDVLGGTAVVAVQWLTVGRGDAGGGQCLVT
jgi:hypothetical protein